MGGICRFFLLQLFGNNLCSRLFTSTTRIRSSFFTTWSGLYRLSPTLIVGSTNTSFWTCNFIARRVFTSSCLLILSLFVCWHSSKMCPRVSGWAWHLLHITFMYRVREGDRGRDRRWIWFSRASSTSATRFSRPSIASQPWYCRSLTLTILSLLSLVIHCSLTATNRPSSGRISCMLSVIRVIASGFLSCAVARTCCICISRGEHRWAPVSTMVSILSHYSALQAYTLCKQLRCLSTYVKKYPPSLNLSTKHLRFPEGY